MKGTLLLGEARRMIRRAGWSMVSMKSALLGDRGNEYSKMIVAGRKWDEYEGCTVMC
jgi:hypothetical protein